MMLDASTAISLVRAMVLPRGSREHIPLIPMRPQEPIQPCAPRRSMATLARVSRLAKASAKRLGAQAASQMLRLATRNGPGSTPTRNWLASASQQTAPEAGGAAQAAGAFGHWTLATLAFCADETRLHSAC